MATQNQIPETGFKSTNEEKTVMQVYMGITLSATITLSSFSVSALIAGVQEYQKGTTVPSDIIVLLSKLYQSSMDAQASASELNIVVDREDVRILKTWLEMRMTHCEKQREEENKLHSYSSEERHFNPDSYIAMKLLLIELREWLLGEEISQDQLKTKESAVDESVAKAY